MKPALDLRSGGVVAEPDVGVVGLRVRGPVDRPQLAGDLVLVVGGGAAVREVDLEPHQWVPAELRSGMAQSSWKRSTRNGAMRGGASPVARSSAMDRPLAGIALN